MTLLDKLNRLIAPINRRISSLICKAVIQSVKNSGDLQIIKLSLLADESISGVDRISEFGFSSVPPSGSEAIVLFPSGSRSNGVIIATDSSQYRLKLTENGSVAIYNQNGDYVKLNKNKITVIANSVAIGDDNGKNLVHEDILSILNGHVHICASPGSASGPALNGVLPNPFSKILHCTSKTEAT